MKSQRSRLTVDVTIVSWVRMKEEKYYLHVRANAAPEREEMPLLPVYVRDRNSIESSISATFAVRVLWRAFSNMFYTEDELLSCSLA